MRTKRTAKDDREYEANLRREGPIKTEVIAELREQNRALWKTQASLLGALINAQDALRVYRVLALNQAKSFSEQTGRCTPGCRLHEWHHDNGWYRAGERRAEE